MAQIRFVCSIQTRFLDGKECSGDFYVVAFLQSDPRATVATLVHRRMKNLVHFNLTLPESFRGFAEDDMLHLWLFGFNTLPEESYPGGYTARIGGGAVSWPTLKRGEFTDVALRDQLQQTVAFIRIQATLTQQHIPTRPPTIDAFEKTLRSVLESERSGIEQAGVLTDILRNTNVTEIKSGPPLFARVLGDHVPLWLWLQAQVTHLPHRPTDVLRTWVHGARCFSDAELLAAPAQPWSVQTAELLADTIAMYPRYHAYIPDRSSRGTGRSAPLADDWLPPEFHPRDDIAGADCEDMATSALRTAHSLRMLNQRVEWKEEAPPADPWLQAVMQREAGVISFLAIGTLCTTRGAATWHAFVVQLDARWVLKKLGIRETPDSAVPISHTAYPPQQSDYTTRLLPAALVECTAATNAILGLAARTFNELTAANNDALPDEGAPPLTKALLLTLLNSGVYPHTVSLTSPLLTEHFGIGSVFLYDRGRVGVPTQRLLSYGQEIEFRPTRVPLDQKQTLQAVRALQSRFPDPTKLGEPRSTLYGRAESLSPALQRGLVLVNAFYRKIDVPKDIDSRLRRRLRAPNGKQLVVSRREIPVSGQAAAFENIRVIALE